MQTEVGGELVQGGWTGRNYSPTGPASAMSPCQSGLALACIFLHYILARSFNVAPENLDEGAAIVGGGGGGICLAILGSSDHFIELRYHCGIRLRLA